jgi:glycosyltransferase involved in cell wall biosynthesis
MVPLGNYPEIPMTLENGDKQFSTTRNLVHSTGVVSSDLSSILASSLGSSGGLRKNGFLKNSAAGPLVTVVTVTFNAQEMLEATILSVIEQTYDNIEYIVVDGGSRDDTLAIVKRYEFAIDLWISESDKGVYDAMNKGIRQASGDWLNFLNAGDTFDSASTLRTLVDQYIRPCGNAKRFIYSDVVLVHKNKNGERRLETYECDHVRKIINHQASVYSKALHGEYGIYLVSRGLTISDYLFFCLVDSAYFTKSSVPIARYDVTGMSQSRSSAEQKFLIDYLINGISRPRFLIYFNLYFYFRQVKSILSRLRRYFVA